MLADRHVKFAYEKDVADALWTDRPAMPATKVWAVPENITGKTAQEKLLQGSCRNEEGEGSASSYFQTG